jgi:hypothetical protein
MIRCGRLPKAASAGFQLKIATGVRRYQIAGDNSPYHELSTGAVPKPGVRRLC